MVKFDATVKAKVLAMSDSRKWLLIKSYIATGGIVTFDSASGGGDAAASVASKLKTDPTFAVVQMLEKCIKEKDSSWLDKFVNANGIQNVLDLIAMKQSLDSEQKSKEDLKTEDICAQTVKKIVGEKEFMERFLATEFAIRKLTLLIGSPNFQTRKIVLQILSGVCLYFEAKPPGHRQVTDALEYYRATKNEKNGRFETIVQSLKEFDSEQYLVCVIRFLNAVALTPVDIEVRQNLRNEYKKVGLDSCIEYLQNRFAETNQVRSQVEVYLEEAGYDEEQMDKQIEGINEIQYILMK